VSLMAIQVNRPDLLVTSTKMLEPRMMVITPQSMDGMYSGNLTRWPSARVTAPKGSKSMNAASNRLTTANSPTITDFLACSFSSRARARIIAARMAANSKLTPSDGAAAWTVAAATSLNMGQGVAGLRPTAMECAAVPPPTDRLAHASRTDPHPGCA